MPNVKLWETTYTENDEPKTGIVVIDTAQATDQEQAQAWLADTNDLAHHTVTGEVSAIGGGGGGILKPGDRKSH